MAKQLKIFWWETPSRYPVEGDDQPRQLRLIVAATSQAEALRIGHNTGARRGWIHQVKNPKSDMLVAFDNPGVIFGTPMASRNKDSTQIRFDPKKGLVE